MNKINKIVFYHNHVNGDCFQSRILVNQIIKETKNFLIFSLKSLFLRCVVPK